ncbi:MarR family transcriptional regulator [Dietzia aurantiaca]|uniref:MarR family winged helix-turn-helix transcriptional regulator n=1 Tax=Dietzia aurantiaca TaxID=983873 RepID=UPI001E4BFF7E|nr:MarR family transcriptional regulator [Dietzia aurantiaca]MCD2262638.1 MarR family transcriptional regulator [Dietzia aurantiaca]
METTTREPVATTGGEPQASSGTAGADGETSAADPAPQAAHDGPALELATLFRPIMLRLDLLVRRQNTQYELSRAQTSILHTLANHGPLRMSYLARLENVRVPTTSNSVSVIESMGYVTRIPDEADRRGVSVALTDLGRDRIKQVLMDRDRDFAEQLSRLSPEHRAVLADAVPALTSLLDAFDAD